MLRFMQRARIHARDAAVGQNPDGILVHRQAKRFGRRKPEIRASNEPPQKSVRDGHDGSFDVGKPASDVIERCLVAFSVRRPKIPVKARGTFEQAGPAGFAVLEHQSVPGPGRDLAQAIVVVDRKLPEIGGKNSIGLTGPSQRADMRSLKLPGMPGQRLADPVGLPGPLLGQRGIQCALVATGEVPFGLPMSDEKDPGHRSLGLAR